MIVPVYKPRYKTPLDCVRAYKKMHNLSDNYVVSYCGRLDPMASGVQLLLVGPEANSKRRELEHLRKTYKTKILFGIATDSLDLLGVLLKCNPDVNRDYKITQELLKPFIGTYEQLYPAFSSAKVNGKPLYYYAHHNLLHTIQIPSHTVEVEEIRRLACECVTAGQVLEQVAAACINVKGNFRQDVILASFKSGLNNMQDKFIVIEFEIKCGGGFYVRQFAADLGAALGVPAVVLEIYRTQVGEYTVDDCEEMYL